MTRITETKSVKVDNWGVFFLQKLQNFFNKTDHCDLTLQFNDNSQLKVHRLVLSACTDYFNMLESTCEMYDDVLIMPLDLQADVIVPIVNFMYTGTLEFQYGIYEKLLKTAKDMNMTVLLKLLEAHKQSTRINQNVGRQQPVLLNKQAPTRARAPATSFHSTPQRSYGGAVRGAVPARTVQQKVGPAVTVVKHQTTIAPVTPYKAQAPDTHALVSKYAAAKGGGKGPTRFDELSLPETLEGNFDDITYESTPLVTADQIKKEEETSPFEKLRKGYTNVAKRPAPVSFSTPVAKKPNLEEVKEFTEAARLRSQLAADDEDSPGFADDTHFDDDEEEEGQGQQQPATKPLPTKASPGLKQIVIKQEPKTSPGSGGGVKQITVKDESGSVDHAKIISEVLKKYPHLVKKNKNIKLKIMQKTSPQAAAANSASASASAPVKMEVRTATPLKADISMVRKATEAIRQPAASASAPPSTPTSSTGPKKIDSKTMHALIAKGAENMTGPWLCLRCGIDGRPISIPSYKAFRNHLIVKHKEKIDARICEHCGWRAEQRNPNLFYHWLTEHNIKSTIKFPTCAECGHVAMNATMLVKHEEENHQRGDLQQCIYCNKVFAKEMDLYDHMKALHKEKAREDGVIDFSDDEYQMVEEEEEPAPTQNTSSENKIKILSNISITNNAGLPFVIDTTGAQTVSQIGGKPLQLQQITLEPSSEAEALSNVASGIATSLGLVDSAGVVIEDGTFHHQNQYIEHQMATVHGETGTTTTITASGPDQLTKLITEDGTELQLTQSQKEEIFSQLQNSGNGGNVVMVLNDDQFITGAGLQLEDGTELINAASASSAAADGQNSNIVVMYSQAGNELSTVTQTAVTTTANTKKSDAVAAAAAAAVKVTEAEDETSQASTQPSSEKDAATVSEKGEDSQMEVDPESSQDKVDEDDEEEDDEEEAARLAKEEEEKAAKEKEKLKLISELEGDWSEDTEEQPTPAEELKPVEEKPKKVEAPKEKEKAPLTSSKAAKEESKKETTEEVANEKEIDRLLDEWHSEAKSDDAEPAADADLEKKLEKVVGEEKTEEEPTKKEDQQQEPVKEEEVEEEEEAEPAAAEQTPDVSVDEASLNDSETAQVVMVVAAAESETETSTREDETSQQEAEAEVAAEEDKKVEEEEKKDVEKDESEAKGNGEASEAKEDEEDGAKEPEEDKTKSKEVVNSLLGDWDEDDDL